MRDGQQWNSEKQRASRSHPIAELRHNHVLSRGGPERLVPYFIAPGDKEADGQTGLSIFFVPTAAARDPPSHTSDCPPPENAGLQSLSIQHGSPQEATCWVAIAGGSRRAARARARRRPRRSHLPSPTPACPGCTSPSLSNLPGTPLGAPSSATVNDTYPLVSRSGLACMSLSTSMPHPSPQAPRSSSHSQLVQASPVCSSSIRQAARHNVVNTMYHSCHQAPCTTDSSMPCEKGSPRPATAPTPAACSSLFEPTRQHWSHSYGQPTRGHPCTMAQILGPSLRSTSTRTRYAPSMPFASPHRSL
eukprot:m.225230 g.225230  ORF g.225230 m.225230 type:complete len:304 (+) comp10833_c1_seq15:2076-2987(+)